MTQSVETAAHSQHHGLFDKLAISMAVICAVHCLLTPALLILLPIFATTFFVHQDFHFWMLFLVIPTSVVAVTLGCRKHKDRIVLSLSALGLALMVIAVGVSHSHSPKNSIATGEPEAHGQHPAPSMEKAEIHTPHQHDYSFASIRKTESILTTMGGLLLVAGHFRNYRRCRSAHCLHD